MSLIFSNIVVTPRGCVRKYASDLPWKWMVEKNSS